MSAPSSATSAANSFSFMSTTSFTSLLTSDLHSTTTTSSSVSRGLGDRIAERTGSGVPKFKSLPPPSLPISPPSATSPSSWFAIPPGLSPAELLDSPILLSASGILPSPTTGTFPIQGFGWKNNSDRFQQQQQQQQDVKIEQKSFPEFSFQTQKPLTSYDLGEERWNYQANMKSEMMNRYSPEMAAIQRNDQSAQIEYNQSSQTQSVRDSRKSDDGYNWRKYGQKQVKGSENPRSYYKCTFANCSVKKKVERSLDGQITEIVYKGSHNHPKPQSTRRSSSSSSASSAVNHSYSAHFNEIPDAPDKVDSSVATPDNSTISVGDDDLEQSSQRSRKGETESEGVSAVGSRAVREPRVVVQTTSDIDILDDGYRWRKYGQKVVKGNPNPRSYYKCTTPGCPVRKHVERASHDPRSVITTYEGKHNHDIPAARGGGSQSLNRPVPLPSNHRGNNAAMANRPTNPIYPMPMSGGMIEPKAGYDLQGMLQNPGSFGYSSFGNSMTMSSTMNDNAPFSSRAKDEPKDDLFLESLLC
ncbi:hypothetical protein C2S53_015598 [Perilla frutescens var. hirtella]|uniref:WRKY domain-containing protein n=1 Tax=Perilla frutescens var. hirtella TaxID=608512 RepID=A0AAD4JNE5_PERFH|nr:hypothetical protein C2S53_015598 [Perilla frutescens var. hirtella]